MKQIPKGTLVVALVSFVLLATLSTLVITENTAFNQLDLAIYQRDHLIEIPGLTTFFSNFAKLATILPTLFFTGLLAIVSWRKQYHKLAVWSVSMVLTLSFVGYVLKQAIHRTRPDVEQLVSRSSYSFPSGHSILSMTLFLVFLITMYIIYREQKVSKFVWVAALYPVLIACSRIYLRVHYPSDIFAGFLLSFLVVFLCYSLFFSFITKKTVRKKHQQKRVFSRKQKGLLAFMLVLFFLVASGVAYGVRFYYDAKQTVTSMQQPLKRETVQREKDTPVSILVLGIANNSIRKTDYRANTIMLVTLNNQKKTTTITSIPRDSFVELADMDGKIDKINHAHSYGGIDKMVDTVERYLEVPIHHYVSLNMDGLEALIDAVGGITVNNAFEFTAEDIHYPEGELELNGWEGLQYARMRAEDPESDYGRQKRQREVVNILVNEFLSVKSLFNYRQLLEVVGENGTTDMSLDQMIEMMNDYHTALSNITNHQLQGEQYIGDGILGEAGIYYEKIPEEERMRVMQLLHEQLEINGQSLSYQE
ncbi:phosphatase PAP2/LCP family protein [Candidatus Enterococcus mangumiae]|uniref:Phosphatidic acid phosphatase type 2/haloperoxidase domain-containing protein n=1 Tax=Candidatus Enterococcus mangumiae TaxID=2230878 RepID=A0ABZ2SY82_9ENTE|nr:phosphatase PAP2/LCP family protein [Enterococcus sp. DIV1094]MBO0491017.1 phosphatase PAP2/LCP family protein [Enterococcus sp. DIV1094]